MGCGALPWPELLLCGPPAADAPENVDLNLEKYRARCLKEMSQNSQIWPLACYRIFTKFLSEFVPLGPRVDFVKWGAMEAGWRGETHPGMGCSLP